MSNINGFYSTYTNKADKHEYDLLQLKEESWRGFGIAFSDGHGNISGGKSFSSPTTQKDYDEDFFQALMEIEPAYKVHDFLTYHFEFYKRNNLGEEEIFIKHIQYVILPMIKYTIRPEYTELTLTWLNKNNKMLLQKQLQEKNEFLKKAYEVAVEYSPSSPLSIDINPREFGKSIGFDEATTTRVMTELVQDGYVLSGLGMHMLIVTQKGVNYLRYIEGEQNSTTSINVNVGNNSNFQFQHGTVNSQQQIEISNSSPEELKEFVQEIKDGLDELKKYLQPEEFENLKAETEYLDNNLQRPTPNKSILKTVTTNILDILKAVPANIIANIITAYIQNPQ